MKTHKKNKKSKNKTLKNNRKCIFLFGYGSLLNDYSRNKTHTKTTKKYPIVLNKDFGYVRKWNTIIPNNKLVLGIEKNKQKNTPINGVLFKVCSCCIKNFLERETRYNLKKINRKYVTFSKDIPKDFNKFGVYTFVTKNKYNNSLQKIKTLKIPKYYKNIIKTSFKHYDKDFKKMFLKTTQ